MIRAVVLHSFQSSELGTRLGYRLGTLSLAGLLAWLRTATSPPKRVFVVHGDPDPAAALAGRVRAELGWEVMVPAYRDHLALA